MTQPDPEYKPIIGIKKEGKVVLDLPPGRYLIRLGSTQITIEVPELISVGNSLPISVRESRRVSLGVDESQ